jgi:influenza virus NS1A-binding protein
LWKLVLLATETDQFVMALSEHTFMALATINGRLATMSVMLRLNQPSSPSPVVTPVASRPASEEKPDLYCVMANMSSVKCAAGCANLNDSLLVCGQCFICLPVLHLSAPFLPTVF